MNGGVGNLTLSPEFRRARARLGAHALHHKRPGIASEAGRKGGQSTSRGYPRGPRAWGSAMALARWHGAAFHYAESRAPAGPGDDGGGAPESGPAAAQRTQEPPVIARGAGRTGSRNQALPRDSAPQQGRLL